MQPALAGIGSKLPASVPLMVAGPTRSARSPPSGSKPSTRVLGDVGGKMDDHPNLQLFQRAFVAFGAADMETLSHTFDEHVVWHSPGNSPLSGNHQGQAATFAMFGNEFQLSNGSIRPDLQQAVATDETVVALLR